MTYQYAFILASRLSKNEDPDVARLADLVATACTMRIAQRNYFSHRSQRNLFEAKEAEAEFDRLANAAKQEAKQGGLL